VWSTVLITLHAVAATVALAAGTLLRRRPGLFRTYQWALALMLVFLVLAIAADLRGRPPGLLALDAALVGLAGYMVWRADRARQLRDPRSPGAARHVGFTLVGLVDAFVVVALVDLGVAGWAVAIVGVCVAVTGHVLLTRRVGGRPFWGRSVSTVETDRAQTFVWNDPRPDRGGRDGPTRTGVEGQVEASRRSRRAARPSRDRLE
jgi:hypothetical protein